jgi:dTDP-L-rhamnose 4-epimerase
MLEWAAIDEAAPVDPRNVYAATKLHQEHLGATWAREAGASMIALRYHNVYGPRMPRDTPYAGVASLFRAALENGRAPEVFEDGRQTRDFVHVRDVARANVLALTATSTPPGAAHAYNVASGVPHTVGELAQALSASIDPDLPPVVNGRWRLGDVRHVVASPARAADALGFVAEVGFEAGMAEFAGAKGASPSSNHHLDGSDLLAGQRPAR